jgi:hypothetical protein
VAHAGDDLETRAADGTRGGAAAVDGHERIGVAVDDERRQLSFCNAGVRSPESQMQMSCRRTPPGRYARSYERAATPRTRASSNGKPPPCSVRATSIERAMKPARSGGNGTRSAPTVSNDGPRTSSAPVFDMIDVSVRTRSG